MKHIINIFIVYIEEAHPSDIWNIGESAGVYNKNHKNLNDRIECADRLKKAFNIDIPIFIDNMNNELEIELSSWPFRYYIIENNKFSLIGTPDDSDFDLSVLLDYIRAEKYWN